MFEYKSEELWAAREIESGAIVAEDAERKQRDGWELVSFSVVGSDLRDGRRVFAIYRRPRA